MGLSGHELQSREKIVSTGRGPTQGSTIQTGSHVEVQIQGKNFPSWECLDYRLIFSIF